MEKKIELLANDTIESAVYTLMAARARGESAYCEFNGHELHSDDVTMDSAYLSIMGCTKEESDRRWREYREEQAKKEQERKVREQSYAERVKASRMASDGVITPELVVDGLRFIAEHQSASQEELINGLLELGCNFTFEDVKAQFPGIEEVRLFEGMRKGNIACGASVIINMRDSEPGRSYCNDRFLSVDDKTSIYHFIRKKGGDRNYTKASIGA